MARNVLIAGAWPYVNGSLHLGHLAALLPGDVLARYHRARGDHVLYVSGSDCHGTPILVAAEKAGVSAKDLADRYDQEFRHIFETLGFTYTLYSKTMGDFHIRAAQRFFLDIYNGGHMEEQTEEQAFCPKDQRFLPDRYVEGTCPDCKAKGARGDQCDNCQRMLTPEELKDPICRTCGTTPVWRKTTHLYFKLPTFQRKLTEWLAEQRGWRANATGQTQAWFAEGLRNRPVTRDLSWGIPVPVPAFSEKKIYVWFEAVMGYLTCSQEWAKITGDDQAWRQWWDTPEAIHYYVHGKDNIPFHTIIWPAILMALGLHLPDKIVSSEYLNWGKEGQKFSKSQGIGVWLPDMVAKFEADSIRFFLTMNGPETSDSHFRWADFQARVNSDLIGNLANFWNRVHSMTHRYFGQIPPWNPGNTAPLLQKARQAFEEIGRAIEEAQFRRALGLILELSSAGNVFLEESQPWKTTGKERADILGAAATLADSLRRLSAPFIPQTARKLSAFLGVDDFAWNYQLAIPGMLIAKPEPLLKPINLPEADLIEE